MLTSTHLHLLTSERKDLGRRKEKRISYSVCCGVFVKGYPNPSLLIAETLDISRNGAKISYNGNGIHLSAGNRISIHIGFNNIRRDAMVVWSKGSARKTLAGINFAEPIPQQQI